MSEDQFNRLIAAITAAKVHPDKLSDEWVYQRAWNDGLDFTLRQINAIKGENHGSNNRG